METRRESCTESCEDTNQPSKSRKVSCGFSSHVGLYGNERVDVLSAEARKRDHIIFHET